MTQSTSVTLDPARGRAIITPTYSGADLTPNVLMQRTENAGQTWIDVRGDFDDGVVSMLSGTSRQFPDYEIPFDVPVQYRTIKADTTGAAVGTTYNLSAIVVLASTGCIWWFHPTDDPTVLGGYMPTGDGGASLGADRGVQYGNNAKYPIVQMGARQGRSAASFSLIARTNVEAGRMMATLGPPSIICVRTPASHGWTRRFLSIGTIRETHPNPIQGGGWVYTFPYVETIRPTNRLEVYGATYDQLAAAYATYGALQSAYGTFDDQTLAII